MFGCPALTIFPRLSQKKKKILKGICTSKYIYIYFIVNYNNKMIILSFSNQIIELTKR
jgi:hypothetical protein